MASEVITAPAVRDRAGLAADLARAAEARSSSTFATTVAHAGACTLAIVAPFELTRPLIQLPHQSISNLEAIVFAAVGSWLVAAVWLRQWPVVRSAITAPWLMLLAAMALSAAAAPTAQLNALHMTGRSAVALAVFTMTINGTTTPARLRRTIVAMVGAGAIVGALAFLE